MNSKFEFGSTDERIVYVRPIEISELPQELQEQAGDLDKVYGVFGSNGEQIALTSNRAMAFDLARDNELQPMSVH